MNYGWSEEKNNIDIENKVIAKIKQERGQKEKKITLVYFFNSSERVEYKILYMPG